MYFDDASMKVAVRANGSEHAFQSLRSLNSVEVFTLAGQMYEYVVLPSATSMTEAVPRKRPRTDGWPWGREEKVGRYKLVEDVGASVIELGMASDVDAAAVVVVTEAKEAEEAEEAEIVVRPAAMVKRPRNGITFVMIDKKKKMVELTN
jgi:hypothetical protein